MKIDHLCSSQDDRWSWLGGQTHRRGAYTRVCNLKVRIDYRHTKYGEFRIVPDGCIEYCGESVSPLQSVKLFE